MHARRRAKADDQRNQFTRITACDYYYCCFFYQNSSELVGREWGKVGRGRESHNRASLFQLEARLWSILCQVRQLLSIHGTTTLPVTNQKKGKGTYSSSWMGNPSQSYGASPAVWDHTVLPATRHRWTRPTLTPAMQAGTRFAYPEGTEGWVDLGGWL